MANLKTLTIDGTSMDNFHPATITSSSKTFSLTSGGSVQLWDTGIIIPKGLSFIHGMLSFPASATGVRFFHFGTLNSGTFSQLSSMRVPACGSGTTILFGYGSLKSNGTATLACRLYQTSGSTQTVTLEYGIRTFPTLVGG